MNLWIKGREIIIYKRNNKSKMGLIIKKCNRNIYKEESITRSVITASRRFQKKMLCLLLWWIKSLTHQSGIRIDHKIMNLCLNALNAG